MPKYLNVNPLFRSKQWLEQKYIIEKLSSQKIADIVSADRKTIDLWLSKCGISKRGFGGTDKLANYRNKNWLRQKYLKEKLSIRAIGELEKKDWSTIRKWLIRFNIQLRVRGEMITGSNSPLWKNGRYADKQGYILIYKPNHPYARHNGYVPQHRLVAEKHLGRFLIPKEIIHHINEVRNDNRKANLYYFPIQSAHMIYHHQAIRGLAPKYLKSNL